MDALRRPLVPILLGLIVILLAVLVALLWRAGPAPALPAPALTAPEPMLAPPQPTAPAPAVGTDAALPYDSAPAPWAAPTLGTELPAIDALQGNAGSEQQRRLLDLHARLQQLSAPGRQPAPAEVADVLRELEAVQGPVVGGVDLRALRGNLEVAGRMQALAAEIGELTADGATPDPMLLEAKAAELRQLQQQLVVPTPPPAAAPR